MTRPGSASTRSRITVSLEHGLADEDAGAWTEERDRLVAELGIAETVPTG